MVQVTFIEVDHESLYTVIRILLLFWHVQKLSGPCWTCTGKQLDSMPRNDAVAELCFGKFQCGLLL
jgi:hypothetical protein